MARNKCYTHYIDKLALIFGVIGAICVGQRLPVGYLIFMLAGVCKLIIAVKDSRPGAITACIIFLITDAYYLYDWSFNE